MHSPLPSVFAAVARHNGTAPEVLLETSKYNALAMGWCGM